MKASAIWATVTLASAAVPAAAGGFGIGIGIGGRIPGTGIYGGIGYSSSRYGRRINADIFVDAGYSTRRKREERREKEDRPSKREGREEREGVRRPAPNVSLDISPGNVWVFLNGVLTNAYGDDHLDLPP